MNVVKPLAAFCLLGFVGLAGCGGKDTGQEEELQPSEPRQAERERILAELQDAGASSEGYLICRNLQQGDPWYPSWVYCCDNDTRTQSFWTGGNGHPTGTFNGSCYSWGLR
ncbi:MAG TPA: hypothetical protein VNA24_24595 [Hyalangium sp.]|nr:hypothetical protein [Hyalangium sp.]